MNSEMVTVVLTPAASDGHHQHQQQSYHQQASEQLDPRYPSTHINTNNTEGINRGGARLRDPGSERDYLHPHPVQRGEPDLNTASTEGHSRRASTDTTHVDDLSSTTGRGGGAGGGSNLDLVISQTLLAGVEIESHLQPTHHLGTDQGNSCAASVATTACGGARGGISKVNRGSELISTQTMTIAQYNEPVRGSGNYDNIQDNVDGAPPPVVAGYYQVPSNEGVPMVDSNSNDFSQNHPHPHPQDIWDQGNNPCTPPRQEFFDVYDGYDFPGRPYDPQDPFLHRHHHHHHHLGLHHHHHLHNHVHQNFHHDFPDEHGLIFAAHHGHNGFLPLPGSGAEVGGSGSKPKRRRVPTLAQRRAANIRERRRMYNLNEAFDQLRTKVPTFAYEKRLSRIETLRLAMTYIQFMSEVIEEKVDKEGVVRVTAEKDQGDEGGEELDEEEVEEEELEEEEDVKRTAERHEVSEVSHDDVMSEPASRNT